MTTQITTARQLRIAAARTSRQAEEAALRQGVAFDDSAARAARSAARRSARRAEEAARTSPRDPQPRKDSAMTARMTTVPLPDYAIKPETESWTTVWISDAVVGGYEDLADGSFAAYRPPCGPDENPDLIDLYPSERQAGDAVAFASVLRSEAEITRDRRAAYDRFTEAKEQVGLSGIRGWGCGTSYLAAMQAKADWERYLDEEVQRYAALFPDPDEMDPLDPDAPEPISPFASGPPIDGGMTLWLTDNN